MHVRHACYTSCRTWRFQNTVADFLHFRHDLDLNSVDVCRVHEQNEYGHRFGFLQQYVGDEKLEDQWTVQHATLEYDKVASWNTTGVWLSIIIHA